MITFSTNSCKWDPVQDNTSCVIKWPDSNQSYIEIDPFETCSTGCTPNETLYHSVLFIALFIIPFMALRNGCHSMAIESPFVYSAIGW